MALSEEMEKTGNWLFRWRSYPPLLVLALAVAAMRHFNYPEGRHDLDIGWEVFCLAVSFIGLGIRIYTVGYAATGTSGRNTDRQVAKSLNTTGPYSVVRHPLYLGNFFIWLGISLFLRSWWFSLIVVLVFWLYYERIMLAEEAYLREKFGEPFRKWAEETPAVVPDYWKWKAPSSDFSLRTVLKREQSGLLGIVCTFAFLEVLGDYFADGKLEIDTFWLVMLVMTFAVFITLTTLKRARVL